MVSELTIEIIAVKPLEVFNESFKDTENTFLTRKSKI